MTPSAHAAAWGEPIGAAPAAAPRPRKQPNLLIRRDLRRCWSSFSSRPLVRWIFFLGATNAALHLLLMRSPDVLGAALSENLHFASFFAFHAYLLGWLPFHCMKAARDPATRATIEDCLVAPMPRRHIFGWLWFRGFCLGLLPVLVFYAPMGLSMPWLWIADLTTDQALEDGRHAGAFEFWREAPVDLLALLLLALPWISPRPMKIAIWALAFGVLVAAPRVAMLTGRSGLQIFHQGGSEALFLFYPSLSHFHPPVTLLYFALAAAYSSALGAAAGLRAGGGPDRALWQVILFGPVLELAAVALCVGDELLASTILIPYMFLWHMLAFYAGPFGVFWLGVKWSLIWRWSRAPILEA